jgi:hypothetical protein
LGKPRNKTERAHDQQEVMRLKLAGYTFKQIAERLGISETTITKDLREIEQLWREQSVEELSIQRRQQIECLDAIYMAAHQAWTSQAGTDGKKAGDPKYLNVMSRVVEQRTKILGLAPKETATAVPIVFSPEQMAVLSKVQGANSDQQ